MKPPRALFCVYPDLYSSPSKFFGHMVWIFRKRMSLVAWKPYQNVKDTLGAPTRAAVTRLNLTPKERVGQKKLVAWLRENGILVMSIPNGAKRSRFSALHERAMGLLPGASDLFIAVSNRRYNGYFVEMKRKGRKPTPVQYKFMEDVRKNGYAADWFDDWEKALESVKDYLAIYPESA